MSTVSVCGTLYHTLPSACICPSSNTHPFYIILLELAFSASLCGLEVEKTVVDITSGLLFYIIGSYFEGILIVTLVLFWITCTEIYCGILNYMCTETNCGILDYKCTETYCGIPFVLL